MNGCGNVYRNLELHTAANLTSTERLGELFSQFPLILRVKQPMDRSMLEALCDCSILHWTQCPGVCKHASFDLDLCHPLLTTLVDPRCTTEFSQAAQTLKSDI